MNKLLLLIFFISLAIHPLYSQKVSVSEDINLRNDDGYAIIGKMKNRVLLFRYRANEYEVQAFDHKLRVSWSKDIELERKNPTLIDVVPSRKDFTVIYQHRKKSHLILRANKYDPAANLIDSTKIIDLGSNWYAPRYNVVLSEDRTKALLYTVEKQTEIVVHSFDVENMKLLWSQRFSPKGLSAPHDYDDIIVDNDGNFYFIIELDNRRGNLEQHRFTVYAIFSDGGKPMTFTLPTPEQQSYDVSFTFDNLNKNLMAAGLYSAKNRGRANGYFFIKVPLNDPDSYLLRYEEFDEGFLSNISGRGVDEEKGISECDIQQIVMRRDGGMLFIVERNHKMERRNAGADRGYSSGVNGQYIVDYYNDDMFAYSVHPDGTTHWNTVMHKKQYSQDDNAMFSSFFLLKTASSLRLIFNDEIRNENSVSEYVLYGNGQFDRNAVMNTESQDIRLRFRDAFQTGASELIIPSERRNRLRLVLLEYQ